MFPYSYCIAMPRKCLYCKGNSNIFWPETDAQNMIGAAISFFCDLELASKNFVDFYRLLSW